jgi:hypothetical protein
VAKLNNKRLAQIIKDPGIATEKEVKLINSFSDEYSYSPFLKVLQARLDNLHGAKDKARSLTKAAIYIADRSILKGFLSNDKLSITPSTEVPTKSKDKKLDKAAAVTTAEEIIPKDEKVVEKDVESPPVVETESSLDKSKEPEKIAEGQEEKAEILEAELVKKQEDKQEEKKKDKKESKLEEKLESKLEEKKEDKQESKLEEKQEEKLEKKQEDKKEDKEEDKKEDKQEEKLEDKLDGLKEELEHSETVDTADDEEPSSLSKEIMENISELKKHKASLLNLLNIDSPSKDKTSKKEKSKKKGGRKDKNKDSVGAESKSEKSDLKTSPPTEDHEKENYPDYEEEDPAVIKDFLTRLEESNPPPKKKLKKEEQVKLIEKFIQSDPQIQNVRSSKELKEKKDLSAHSVKFRDDIISENLASIMIKQGKLETAIDIYKKLIWKFPQKKAYFATQIEELKKKLKK